MAATVLDDRGQLLPWPDSPSSVMGRPFSIDVLLHFQPQRAGLGHWTRVRVQSHEPLVTLLRQQGLLLIRDWALLAHSSATRMARLWRWHGRDGLDLATVSRLHAAYGRLYDRALEGSNLPRRRWDPSDAFLEEVDPDVPARITRERLQAMASALRRERLGQTPCQVDAMAPSSDGDPDDISNDRALVALLDDSLRRALERQLPAMLGSRIRPCDVVCGVSTPGACASAPSPTCVDAARRW